MGNKYSDKQLKKILENDLKIPGKVQDAIEESYSQINGKRKVTMHYTRRHRHLVVLAATIVLVLATSAVVFASSRGLLANLVKGEEKVNYSFHVDREKEAHEIEVVPGYLPKGYKAAEADGPYAGKWIKEGGEAGLSIIPMNASELDEISRTQGAELEFKKEDFRKEIDINGTKAAIFSSGEFIENSTKNYVNLFLFNEEEGYGVQIFSDENIPEKELIKVAENLKIKVLDTVVPYKKDEQIEAVKKAREQEAGKIDKEHQAGVKAQAVKKIGDEISDGQGQNTYYPTADIRFTVENVQVVDSLPADQYPTKYYSDFDGEIAPWLNEDGTLKQHDRYKYPWDKNFNVQNMEDAELEKVNSKFVVVKMKVKNHSDSETGDMVWMAPELTSLIANEDGSCSFPNERFSSVDNNYILQWNGGNGSSYAVYYDDPYYTEGAERARDFLFRPVLPGEEREYTVAYVVDEDQLEQMHLRFFTQMDMMAEDTSIYVDISQ